PDLQIEERIKFVQASYQSGTIYEWNIDGMNEYHIINKLQEMTMVISNAYKIKNASDKVVANLLITGFTGQLKEWWDNVITVQQQTEILDLIQTDEIGPILDLNNEPIEDAVATLIYNITKYFIEDPTYLKDRTVDQLSNLRCRKLHKFIISLPTLFTEKIKDKYKEINNGIVPYDTLTYDDIVSTITKIGLEICNDIKNKQIKRDTKIYKKKLGDFCTQFGY
ncbi:LOW QUALITY PROTEIN: hypothetical protein CFOL_v3_11602, partial [Cephalotus follicularis]